MQQLRTIKQFFLDILYPNRCPCCRQFISWQSYLCDACHAVIDRPTDRFCARCGKLPTECLCGTDLAYDYAIVLTDYIAARSGILSLKTAESLNFAYACGAMLADRIIARESLMHYDLLVPVPMSKQKKRRRKFNPAEKVAKEIANLTNIPMRSDILVDTNAGKAQHTLSEAARKKNTQRFSIRQTDLTGYRIMLCDDILTTGSTMHQCASLLKQQGAAEVTAIAIASTERWGSAKSYCSPN